MASSAELFERRTAVNTAGESEVRMSERWGAFSVIDHKDAAALAADVLLYDRLLLPVPPDENERRRWRVNEWEPDLQEERLKILGDLARPMAWNDSRQQTFSKEMDRLRAEGKKVNGYLLTGIMLAKEIQSVNVVAAYHSGEAFQGDFPVEADAGKQAWLGYLLGSRFAVPSGTPEEALTKAVQVARIPEFQEHRLGMYKWQEEMIDKNVPLEDAVNDMAAKLSKYNACVEAAVKEVYYKFGFTLLGLGIGLGSLDALSAAGALVTMVGFAKLDTKITISPGLNTPAAMFHDFENAQKSFWNWTKH
jgi:hypothetical protein